MRRTGILICVIGSILEKAKEQLGVLSALRTATETYSEQKRKRKDAPTDAQPSKTKKAKTYHPLPSQKQHKRCSIVSNIGKATRSKSAHK